MLIISCIFRTVDRSQYEFPLTKANIDDIVALSKPKDIDIINIRSKEEFFDRFIKQINEWLNWFDRFVDIFQHIIDWLKTHNVNRSNQVLIDLIRARDDHKITLIQVRITVDDTLKLLQPFKDIRRLCQLFNCLIPFQILNPGKLDTQGTTTKFLTELKRFQANNTFTVEGKRLCEQNIFINDRQQVQWSLASENQPCDITVEYRSYGANDQYKKLFQKENVSIHKHVLHGQFESQRNGQLLITIDNRNSQIPRIIWYQIKSIGLSTCHLFHGIFDIYFNKCYEQSSEIVLEEDFSQLLDRVFDFINKLLNGDISLRAMTELRAIFCDKNINIRDEVKKLYMNRSNEHNNNRANMLITAVQFQKIQPNEKEIEQVCEWLQIYQYYSHINVIMKCIEKFDLLPSDNEDMKIGHLKHLSGNENCSLREITQAYRILQECFKTLTHQHLQLIKIAVECSNVIHMMKKADLYSQHGRRRFQELRDNLTTQFQLQELNNMILNSWIITYTLIEPFMFKAKNFDDFVLRIAQLTNIEGSSLNHIKIINDNMQLVTLWLSAEETTVLDNALITMEHLFKNGTVDIRLRRLTRQQSYYEIGYSIDRIQVGMKKVRDENDANQQSKENDGIETKKIQFQLSMSDIDDHKRQLTFCNVDVQQNLIYKKALINGQLKLLKTVENIYHMFIKLELGGHPDYQLRDEHYEIHLQEIQVASMLSDLRSHQNARLENAIQTQIQSLELIYHTLKTAYDKWIQNLKKYRQECSLLKLFSNREIMILIILLRTSNAPNSIRRRLFKKLFEFEDLKNQNEEEQKLTMHCLAHYLRSLRISHVNLTTDNLRQLYQKHLIDAGSNTDVCLQKLAQFLQNLFEDNREIFEQGQIHDENLQFLVSINPPAPTPNRISFSHDFDLDTCCILLNIFQTQLPASYQILWCSNTTEEDIHLFFSRIRTFTSLTFAIMDIDKMHHRLREILFNEQDLLTRENNMHAQVFYFSRELTTGRKGLREFQIPIIYKDPDQSYQHLINLFNKHYTIPANIQIIYGKVGIGKTHRFNKEYKTDRTSCFSINDKLNFSLLISSFLSFNSNMINDDLSIFLNTSIHAPFETLNRTLFSLFICGCLNDSTSGLIFSLPHTQTWKFIIEVPYSDVTDVSVRDNFNQILPILSIISSSTLEEVTYENYQLSINKEEELVARFLKAFEDQTIDRIVERTNTGHEIPVSFEPITNADECRRYIYNSIEKYARELPKNKIYELSFVKFLYRRVRFFEGHYYCWNQRIKNLGSIVMQQMINEAKSLTQINFQDIQYPRVYLVYDPEFALHLLHSDWNHVSNELKSLFHHRDPLKSIEYQNKDYFAECLAWLIDIKYETFMKILNETKFILTENFAYKLFHVHERKLTKLALIIEGDTGVGKTFLLKFYSLLLNSKSTGGSLQGNIISKILENSNQFLLSIIETIIEPQPKILNVFLQRIKSKIVGNDDEDEAEILNQRPMQLPVLTVTAQQQQNNEPIDDALLKQIKQLLKNHQLKKTILYHIWRTLLSVSTENATVLQATLIKSLHDYVTNELINYPLIESSCRLQELLQDISSSDAETTIEIFKEYLFNSKIKPLFYRLLLHPGVTEEQLVEFMSPISQLARELPEIEIVVFFDEVNTASCLGLFKEMFMDGTLRGTSIPSNIFFTAAINPFMKIEEKTEQVYRTDYIVHELPQSLKCLKVSYGTLESKTLADYITRKIAMFQVNSSVKSGTTMPLEIYLRDTLADSILKAQEFCEINLGHNSVSQREIQRCFNLINFFWTLRYDDELKFGQKTDFSNPMRCIALSIALTYYFRLPTKEDNLQRNDKKSPSREQLAELLSHPIPNFDYIVQNELERFVNTDNFIIPRGVAINKAVREHIFSIVVSIVTRTALCIIGVPGQSKTLSFQIVLQNLQGAQLSATPFCKRLPAINPFFCLGSKYSRSEDIASIFERAIKREQQYEQNRMNTRCVVFLDEASLPDEKKMVLKVLHPYLDECKVAFVAVANKAFDAANANRMICIYRSLPSEEDQKILAYGCLGLQLEQRQLSLNDRLDKIICGLCQGYRRILRSPDIPHIFHDRDFIYMLRELRFELMNLNEVEQTNIGEITQRSLLRALEDNFNGVRIEEFDKLVNIFATAVGEQCPEFRSLITEKQQFQRNVPTILRNSMKLDPIRRRLYGRYKLIIDESEDESAVRLLFQCGILSSDPTQTTVFRMSDFPDDIDNELRNVEILSNIKLCMETGKTILMINTGRIHDSLYDVFNQNFSIMATEESRKIFSKVAIGPKTIDVIVHEDFQCIVHIKRSEFKDIPAPFLSRFQKFSFSISDFYSIQLREIPIEEQELLRNVEKKAKSFIDHFGKEYFYGLNNETLYSCLSSFIKRNVQGELYLSNIYEDYNQLTIQSKPFIEQDINDKKTCFLFYIISKLLQLASPESMIFKLPTFDESTARSLCQHYFYQQEHFNLENFLYQMISTSTLATNDNELLTMNNNFEKNLSNISITRKLMIFTRTSSSVISLNQQSKNDLFRTNDENDTMTYIGSKVDIINLAIIENSNELIEQFQTFELSNQKSILITVIDGRMNQQRIHIPFVRQLIDKTDLSCNKSSENPSKFFIILIHSSGQELNYKACFSSIFLHNWDYWFLDTSTTSNAFHLQKMLQIFTSKIGITHQKEALDNSFYDLNMLFDDCLYDFCSRLQINVLKLSEDMFNNQNVYEFYQRQTSTCRRLQCLKSIFQELNELQKHIITSYHEKVSMKEDSLRKNCNSIYNLAKDTLFGKCLTGLVDSLYSHIRISFTNFVSFILKYVIDDYGLESLTKLSSKDDDYSKLLELIDYSLFSVNDENQTIPMMQRIITLNDHYSCIPQTPLFYLCQQRIKNLADKIKPKLADQQNQFNEQIDDLRFNYYDPQVPTPPTKVHNNFYGDKNETDNTREQFRNELVRLITNDTILSKIISSSILQSYTNDSVRVLCTIIEKNFHDNQNECKKTIDFVSRWLILIDDDEQVSLNSAFNRNTWLLAHVYTSLEYDQNDLLSLYSACRITESLDLNQSFYEDFLVDEKISRSKVRENLFRLMFHHLWTNLCHLCQTNEDTKTWIHSYALISKYYPSDKVLQRLEFVQMKFKIEFMSLVYLILLNEKTPQPVKLIQRLLNETSLTQDDIDGHHMNFDGSSCLQLLPTIIQTIDQYFEENNSNNGTLMMDIQQWIIATIKVSKRSSRQEIISLLKFLNQTTCHLSLPMKQFLFDELINILIENSRQNHSNVHQQFTDAWDRIALLSIIMECINNENLENYQIPYHPSVISNTNPNHLLIDLFFFHLRRLINDERIRPSFIHKILVPLSNINIIDRIPIAENVFKQLKEYFLLETTALLLCQSDLNNEDQQRIDSILTTVINQYLKIETPSVQLSKHVEHFCSVIITKKSWNFLVDLLKSERINRLNTQWADTLHKLFAIKYNTQHNKHLHYSHQLQFTLTTDQTSSIFPTLHQPYHDLTEVIDECVKNTNDGEQRWIPLINWIQSQLNSNPPIVNATEIKVMLLLNIYYNYYCNAQLNSLNHLLIVIERTLQPCDEEQRVFRVLLQPEQHMIGYPGENNPNDKNYLNDLFKLDYQDDEQLPIRHTLVNLLAMILLSGKENTLWTFAFEPLKLEGTYGFGSTATRPIRRNGIHYDCGCVISEKGELQQLYGGNELSVPAVYIAFFATFGAMAWYLLLFESSVENLYGPILAKQAIDATAVTERISNDNFQSNQDDTCVLLNQCFELFAQYSRQRDLNPWIKPLYKTNIEKLEAEKEFQNKIFYPTYKNLADYKQIINTIQSQSEPQTKLQNYISQIPIIIEVIHFKTELCNPESSQLPLTILRRLLNSFEFLKMTRYVYALSQFHVLLHRTFTQLIELEEFYTITLKQLYERVYQSSNRLRQPNQQDKYYTIIEKGIEAVNAYHTFANGQIRPGACDLTQRFETISIETPVSYLVETDNYDEGDIIMRILSVLINHHNNLLELLETEINQNGDTLGLGPLKDIIRELSERKISILQITQENMGVITLNKIDCQWIEQLSRASLENENGYFLKLDKPLKFNFLYVQSYLIRTYLLYCRINYQHIKGKYQCYTKRKVPITTNDVEVDNNIDKDFIALLADEWNHLEQKNLDQLKNELNFLQRIMDVLKNFSEDYSSMKLSEFIKYTNYDGRFSDQFEQYKMKDFTLSQIKSVYQLYERSINLIQHAYINVSHLIRVPLDKKLNDELDYILKSWFILSNDQPEKEKLQAKIRTITEFLNDLKDVEHRLDGQWAKSFAETCEILSIENSIVSLIPKEIKCENYVPLCLKFIQIRSQLQEQVIGIEEKIINIWNARFDVPNTDQRKENSFNVFRNKDDDILRFNATSNPTTDSQPSATPEPTTTNTGLIDWLKIIDIPNVPDEALRPSAVSSQVVYERTINYTSLFKLKITSISLPLSGIFEKSRTQVEQAVSKTSNMRFTITFTDGKQLKYHCKPDRLYIRLKSIFDERRYDLNAIGIIDPNQILVDFMKTTVNNFLPIIETEYYITEKTLLTPIILEFQNNQFEYFVKAEATITSILSRFILDQQLEFTPPNNYFSVFDSLGRYVAEDCQFNTIYRFDEQNPVHLQILRCNQDSNICCEITLTTSQDETRSQYFNPTTAWKHISLWSKTLDIKTKTPVDSYFFWNIEQKHIIDENETISYTLGKAESINVDVVDGESVIDIIVSYDKNSQRIHILNSCPVHSILNNPKHLEQLGLKISPQDCTLVFVLNESEKQILEKLDMENPISYYASMTKKPIHFQIAILIQIIQYDNGKGILIPISHRNITMKELLEMIEVKNEFKYLASYEIKMILPENTILSMINETKFFLVKEHQTCLISIQQSEDALLAVNEENMRNQRYLINATINDIYKQNENIDQNQYLVYARDFVPSRKMPLSLFLSNKNSLIVFNLIYQKLQANVTVTSDEQKSPIEFQCEPNMTIARLHQIICQLWKLNKRLYSVALSDNSIIDEDNTLNDIDESIDDLKLKLISIADLKCAITYRDGTCKISATYETLLSSIMKEALETLLISLEDIDMYELKVLDDPDNPTSVDLESSINDIRTDFHIESDTLPFLLEKKKENES
ncbi:unnamed protein product [Rotaria sp. Silwood1]|nr:unnamed protein product [Rotaria sp. Silwood1]CAF1590716.1 unnamed protein product [Rotaria sp. Silwood1]